MTKPRPMDEQRKSLIWHEWERGTPMANIARVIDKPPATFSRTYNIMVASDHGKGFAMLRL